MILVEIFTRRKLYSEQNKDPNREPLTWDVLPYMEWELGLYMEHCVVIFTPNTLSNLCWLRYLCAVTSLVLAGHHHVIVHLCNLSHAAVIVQQLRVGSYPVLRPQISIDDCDAGWLETVEACWNEVPSQRPSATAVKRTVRKLSKLR